MSSRPADDVGPSADRNTGTGRLLFWLSVLLVGYGSLYPFQFSPPAALDDAFKSLLSDRPLWSSTGDVAGNIVLCVPLGVFAWDLPMSKARLWRISLICAACVFYAVVLQVLQLFFPPRVPALGDAVWNSLGVLLGATCRGVWDRIPRTAPRSSTADRWPLVLVALWVLTQLAPWVPSLDWQLVKDGIKSLVLTPELNLPKLFNSLAKVTATALMLAAARPGAEATRNVILLLVAVLAAKLLIAGQGWTPASVGGFVGGFGLWMLLRMRAPSSAYIAALLVLLAAYSIEALTPLGLKHVPSTFHWIPFQSMLNGAMDTNAWALLDMAFVFGALLWLGQRAGASLGGWIIALSIWVGCLEVAQMWVVDRTSDLTPALIVLILGYVMHKSYRIRSSLRPRS